MPERLPGEYRAWGWHGSADPRDLRLETRAIIAPGSDDVIVRNRSIGLNPVDWKVLGGELVDWKAGHVPGVDGAGEIVALGRDVDPAWLGRRVAYHQSLSSHGSFAEYVPLRANVLLDVPSSMDLAQAAGIPCPALTAWLAIEKLPVPDGDELLISGAGGSVGNYLVQFAASRGWQVAVMCNSRHKERLAALGASDWIAGPLPEGRESLQSCFMAIIDAVGPDHAGRLSPTLFANGHLVCIQGRVPQWPDPPFSKAVSLHEVALGALHQHGTAAAWSRLTKAGGAILQDIAAGHLSAEPLVTDSFEHLPDLLDALRFRDFTGKPVITVN